MAIYLRAGNFIYVQRKQLLSFHQPSTAMRSLNDPSESTKIMEVHITSEAIENIQDSIDIDRLGGPTSNLPEHPFYSVTVSTDTAENHVPTESQFYPPAIPSPSRQTTSNVTSRLTLPPSSRPELPRRNVTAEANRAAFSYAKVAILFFTAMLVTWIPSSANRVYSLAYPGYISPQLQFASALVLPLQGFWNSVIYTTTSGQASKNFITGRLFQTRPKPVIFDKLSGVWRRGTIGRDKGDRLGSVDREGG